MSALFVVCGCGRNKISQVAPHQKCLQCLGLQHPFDLCPQCLTLSRSCKARRSLQLKAWAATGQFMSRAKAVAYFKQIGSMDSVRAEISASFSTTVNDSQILSGNVKGPLLSYGTAIAGVVEDQNFSEPVANSSSLESHIWDDNSTFNESHARSESQGFVTSQQVHSHVATTTSQSIPDHTLLNTLGSIASTLETLKDSLLPKTSVVVSTSSPVISTMSLPATTTTTSSVVTTQSSITPVLSSQVSSHEMSHVSQEHSSFKVPHIPPLPTHSLFPHAGQTSEASLAGTEVLQATAEGEEMIDVNHINMIHKASLFLAPALGLETKEIGNTAPHVQTLSLFSRRKVKKQVLFSVPPEFAARDKELHSKKPPKDLVPPSSKQVFRLNPEGWAQLIPDRMPDKELLARSSYNQKTLKKGQSVPVLSKQHNADRVQDFHKVNVAASHSFRLASASAVLQQFVLEETSHLMKDIPTPVSPILQQRLDRILSASQLSIAAAADLQEIASRTRVFAAHKERNVWLDNSRFDNKIVKEAKELPIPLGSLDQEGQFVKPLLLGEPFVKSIDDKYKSQKHMDKVAPDRKRQASSQGGGQSKRQNNGGKKGGKTPNPSFKNFKPNTGSQAPPKIQNNPGFRRAQGRGFNRGQSRSFNQNQKKKQGK